MTDPIRELSEALKSGDQKAIERAQRRMRYSDEDRRVDEGFLQSMRGKTLHKNMSKMYEGQTQFSALDYAKTLSSLMTHYIIEAQNTGKSLKELNVQDIYIVLGSFVNGAPDEQAIRESRELIEDRYGDLLKD